MAIEIVSRNNRNNSEVVRVQLQRSKPDESGKWRIIQTHGFTIKGITDLDKIEEICTQALKKAK